MPISLITYNLIFLLILIPGIPVLAILSVVSNKVRCGLFERFGFVPKKVRENTKGKKNIWLHASSAGEVKSIIPFMERMRSGFAGYNIIISTGTLNGRRVLKKHLPEAPTFYLPFDFYFFVKPYVKLINPELLIVAETEIWPFLFYYAKKKGAKIVVVNGRFSRKNIGRYKLIKNFIRNTISLVDGFGMRTKEDYDAVLELGAEKAKVELTGDIKYEAFLVDEERRKETINIVNSVCFDKIIVAGSVHLKETEMIIDAYKQALLKYPFTTIIIAPRFMEEAEEIEKIAVNKALTVLRRTGIKRGDKPKNVIILDSFGELSLLYGIADAAIVGGSFADGIGGHNMLEPVFFGKPVIYGRFYINFQEIGEELISAGIGKSAGNSSELAGIIENIFSSGSFYTNIEERSKDYLNKRKGPMLNNLELILKVLKR